MTNSHPKPLRLLSSIPSKMYSRTVVRYPHQSNRDYALAYHLSAKRLASTFSGRPEDDLILMPFLVLYRHAFELQLKNLIQFLVQTRITYRDGANTELLEAGTAERLRERFGHNLHRLLNETKKHYVVLDLPDEFPPDVEKVVLMLHEADREGMSFRYAGELPDTQEHADFVDLATLLDEQYTILSVAEDYVDGCYSPMPTLGES